MKILVIDDNPMNLSVAKEQFADHDVTVVDSFHKGNNLLVGEYDEETGCHPYSHTFDMVLVDLMMPVSEEYCDSPKSRVFLGQEMPVGVFLGILAAMNGAKYVGLLTLTNHHDHPASAIIDWFKLGSSGDDRDSEIIFRINDCKVVFSNVYRTTMGYYNKETDQYEKGGKDWLSLWRYLVGETSR